MPRDKFIVLKKQCEVVTLFGFAVNLEYFDNDTNTLSNQWNKDWLKLGSKTVANSEERQLTAVGSFVRARHDVQLHRDITSFNITSARRQAQRLKKTNQNTVQISQTFK